MAVARRGADVHRRQRADAVRHPRRSPRDRRRARAGCSPGRRRCSRSTRLIVLVGFGTGSETPGRRACATSASSRRRSRWRCRPRSSAPSTGWRCRRRSRPGCSSASARRSASSCTRAPGAGSSGSPRILGVVNLAFLGGAIVGGVLIERDRQPRDPGAHAGARADRRRRAARPRRRGYDPAPRPTPGQGSGAWTEWSSDGPGAARDRRADRDHHQRQPRQAQRVRRRDGRRAVRRSSPSSTARPDVRAVDLAGRGQVVLVGPRRRRRSATSRSPLSHHELMRRGHRGIQQLWELDAPVIVACKGWVMGGSFQRALLCDIRVAAEGTRFRLPEVTYGVIPDTGGVARALRDVRARRRERHGAHRPDPVGRGGARARHREPGRARRRARRDRARDGRADRVVARGHGEDGPRGDPPPRAAADPRVDGRRDDLPDVHQPQRRHGRAARRRAPRSAPPRYTGS